MLRQDDAHAVVKRLKAVAGASPWRPVHPRRRGQLEIGHGRLDAHDVTVATTANRQILGTMNDHVGLIEHIITTDGGLTRCDLDTLHHSLHRTINSATGYVPSIELAIELVDAAR